MRRFEGPSWRLKKLENRTYRAIAELGSDPVTGRRRTGSRKFTGTRAQVKAAAEEWFADLCDRTADPDLRGRAEQLLAAYLASWLESKRGTIKDSAWSRYGSLIRTSLSPALGWVRLCDLSPQHIRHYVAECRTEPSTHRPGQMVSPKTMQNRLGVLGTALRQAVREGLINRNPLDAVDKPRVSRTPLKIVGEPEAAKVRKAAEGTDLEMIVRVALATGARLGELLALRWRDIDLEHRRVNISRTISERVGKRSTDLVCVHRAQGSARSHRRYGCLNGRGSETPQGVSERGSAPVWQDVGRSRARLPQRLAAPRRRAGLTASGVHRLAPVPQAGHGQRA